ncbi:IS66 family transposase [Shimia thalassica]|nr:IS66 family transposase [Shimia thalassica]
MYEAEKSLATKRSGEVTHLKSEIRTLRNEIAKKDERIKELLHTQHGQKSETAKAQRGDQTLNTSSDANTGETPKSNRPFNYSGSKLSKPRNKSGRRPKNWDNLERIEIDMDFPETCPCGCGGSIRSWDVDEKREVIPAKVFVAVRKLPRYRCRKDETIIGSLYKPTLVSGINSGTSMLAYLVTMRFGWGMPWYRIENKLNHEGIVFRRSTMCAQVNKLAKALEGVFTALERHTLDDAQRVFFDETPLKIQRPGTGKTGQAFMYAGHRDDSPYGGNAPRATVYYYRPTRAMTHIHEIFSGKTLIAQHDGYAGYNRLGNAGTDVSGILSVECWVHTRRNFIKAARVASSPLANEITKQIDKLYIIEEEIRGWPPDRRVKHRQSQSTPIIEEIWSRLNKVSPSVPQKSTLGKAIRYALERRCSLELFLEDGRIDLDTNPVERQFKPIILLRKGVLFVGSEEGGNTWAMMSSLVETCKLNRVDPFRYFEWMIDDLALAKSNFIDDDIDFSRYLPWNAPVSCTVSLPNLK